MQLLSLSLSLWEPFDVSIWSNVWLRVTSGIKKKCCLSFGIIQQHLSCIHNSAFLPLKGGFDQHLTISNSSCVGVVQAIASSCFVYEHLSSLFKTKRKFTNFPSLRFGQVQWCRRPPESCWAWRSWSSSPNIKTTYAMPSGASPITMPSPEADLPTSPGGCSVNWLCTIIIISDFLPSADLFNFTFCLPM